MIKLYFLSLGEKKVWSETDERLLLKISKERAEHIRSLKKDTSKLTSLYSALLTRYALESILNTPADRLKFDAEDGKKPRLADGGTDIDFNISHTKGAVLVGVSKGGSIGVDIENFKRRKAQLGIMKRFYHPDEAAYVNSQADGHTQRFFECWTRKEAYLKRDGRGLSAALNLINTANGEIASLLHTWREGDYICSVCAEELDGEASLDIVTCHNLSRALHKSGASSFTKRARSLPSEVSDVSGVVCAAPWSTPQKR